VDDTEDGASAWDVAGISEEVRCSSSPSFMLDSVLCRVVGNLTSSRFEAMCAERFRVSSRRRLTRGGVHAGRNLAMHTALPFCQNNNLPCLTLHVKNDKRNLQFEQEKIKHPPLLERGTTGLSFGFRLLRLVSDCNKP
jgi:hypothetical protein